MSSFPPFDSASEQILRGLVSKQSFDPDCLLYDSAVYRGEDEGDLSYNYFGNRLVELFEELEDPSPRGILETWFQRKSGRSPCYEGYADWCYHRHRLGHSWPHYWDFSGLGGI